MTTPLPRSRRPQQESLSTVREFERGLTSMLHRLRSDPSKWLIIAEMAQRPPLRYVQFLADKEGTLVAECVSNRYLDESDRWRPDQEALLLELGWSAPRDDRPNWHFVARNVRTTEQIPEIIGLTLSELFFADDNDVVELKTYSSAGMAKK